MAAIGQEITLKRLQRIDSECVEIERESTNPKHRSIRIDEQTEEVEIVVGVIAGPSWGCPHTRLNANPEDNRNEPTQLAAVDISGRISRAA